MKARSGFFAGALAGIATSVAMLLLACFGFATPLVIFGDRLSVFIPADNFLALMGRVGGYNHMKQLGVGSVLLGQIFLGAIGGAIYAKFPKKLPSLAFFVLLPLIVLGVFLWPVLGTNYSGLPINAARIATLLGMLVAFVVFERTLVLALRKGETANEFSPSLGRRGFLLGGIGILLAASGAGLLRKLYRAATFSYDGTQYKGADLQPITPNDKFYCVTKNVIDPKVDAALWRLEINGLVQTRQTFRLDRLKSLPFVTQETTLMCISNGIGAGLMSNAVWRGVPMAALLKSAGVRDGAAKVRLHGVDNYTDTFPIEKAMDPTTLVVYEMNGEPLPDRHGFPARAIVPGYFGEKHVKWITRIEVCDESAEGFYEKQGWGPDFTVPTRSRIDVPEDNAKLDLTNGANGIPVKGVAFGGDRGISRVELSADDGATWSDAKITYAGTKLTWALWSYDWRPKESRDYKLVVRATDGEGAEQEWEEDRPIKSGITGFHKITVHVVA